MRFRQELGKWNLAIRIAIDPAARGAFQIKVGSAGYPPDLETLVKGVDVGGKKMRSLRRIPIDPTTNSAEWGLRSMRDGALEAWFVAGRVGHAPNLNKTT